MTNPRFVFLDFELGSALDLTVAGAFAWTQDASTTPICCAFAFDDEDPDFIIFDNINNFQEDKLLGAVHSGAEIHAWNANFEFNVWTNIMAPRFNWPRLPIEQFHCTMASAACAGLPMDLADAAVAVGSSHLKSKTGHALMRRMARPRRADPDGTLHWWHREDPAKLASLVDYNLSDVLAEHEVHLRIPRMTARERVIWLADQRMNARGLPVDFELLDALRRITDAEVLRLCDDISLLTCGEIPSTALNVRLLQWAQARGYPHNTLKRDTLDAFIASSAFRVLDPVTRAVLTVRSEASKTSTAKLNSISHYARHDGRARGLVQYGGAVRTLRWAGRGPQIQNFPKPIIQNTDQAIEGILGGLDAECLRLLFGRPLDVVSSCLRGVFKALPGMKFVVCDYRAIEAVVIAWLADFEELLEVFRRGEDVYTFTAKSIGSNNRQLGKVLRLACGFGMGGPKFHETAKGYDVSLELSEAVDAVREFRRANAALVALWHAIEACAKNAISFPGQGFAYKKIRFRMAWPDGRLAGSLLMELPSGRNLVYRDARLESNRIVFWGVDQYRRVWAELDTYGGKLAENATQAIARDLLADTVVSVERTHPGTLLTTVHDEIVAMDLASRADELLRFMRLAMSAPPAWGKGLPLSCSGVVVDRYGKL